MLSIACDEPTSAQEAEPLPAALPVRRLAVTFESSARRRRSTEGKRERGAVSVPAYSRIVFRAGAASAR